ncbi:hypothetical protein M0R45_012747 [Rubus argutus]|uniref:X8 domain-containing protein n=1 Tax=Rubus argutus TaxID=59490 RepID=A0AAW1XG50_RUBAR
MPSIFVWLLLALLLTPQRSGGQLEEWCIADEQTPADELKMALDWACGKGGADCKIQAASATCYFNAAAMVTALDPSHNSCKFEYLP